MSELRVLHRTKGKLLEGIVAAMHSVPGVIVRTNAWVPAVNSPERKREIDVLIDGAVAGYPIRKPIECKNGRIFVKPEQIDAFEGKLRDIGLSGSQGLPPLQRCWEPVALTPFLETVLKSSYE